MLIGKNPMSTFGKILAYIKHYFEYSKIMTNYRIIMRLVN